MGKSLCVASVWILAFRRHSFCWRSFLLTCNMCTFVLYDATSRMLVCLYSQLSKKQNSLLFPTLYLNNELRWKQGRRATISRCRHSLTPTEWTIDKETLFKQKEQAFGIFEADRQFPIQARYLPHDYSMCRRWASQGHATDTTVVREW